jgi:kynurenine 3-monooxygenase
VSAPRECCIVGAGLAGSLLGILLAQRGWRVDLFERRYDPRQIGYEGGRSINLALAERGLHALRQAGLEEAIMAQAIMMRGRMVHVPGQTPQLQRYGRDDSEVIWSVHRGRLNLTMLDAAEKAGARIHFNAALEQVDWNGQRLHFRRGDGHQVHHDFEFAVGADGAGSALRREISRERPLDERIDLLGHGYKELEIPPAEDSDFRIEPHALHIWPRGRFMCIALPNCERSFTVTLFLPNQGPHPSFESVPDGAAARAFFAEIFTDALALMPDLARDFDAHPVGMLATLRLDHWYLDQRAVLLGDAAHAMVPFHGQGMNCAFEDCIDLAARLDSTDDRETAFAAFQAARQPNARAIQAMALENYLEMRDRVDDADYLLQRQLERLLAERHPGRFVPRYSMVSFSRLPYATAFERGKTQRTLLEEATHGARSLDQVDLHALDRHVQDALTPIQYP